MQPWVVLIFVLLMNPGLVRAETDPNIDEIIDLAYRRDSLNRSAMDDLTFSTESYSRKLKGSGEIKEEKKFFKTYYFKDTLFKAEFLEYFKNSEKQSEKKLRKEVEDITKKGRARDATINTLIPFYPKSRTNYRYNLLGVEGRAGYTCYHVTADCLLEDEDLIEGDYWFETANLNLVAVEFHPSKMPGPIKQLDMEMTFTQVKDRYWLPQRFHLFGRGKVMLFIKFYFEAEEFYTDPKINSGLSEDFFQEKNDEK